METCPVCSTEQFKYLPNLPYVECVNCHLYYQQRHLPKTYEAVHEVPGNQMSEADRAANMSLARALWSRLKGKEEYYHFDIGSKYPYLGYCLQTLGSVRSLGIDGIPEVKDFGHELKVSMIEGDFENEPQTWKYHLHAEHLIKHKFDLVTLVHCIEHFYDPLDTLLKIRSRMVSNGTLFIRCPDHQVKGIERDWTHGHYSIHPVVWCEQAMYEALYQLGACFVVQETYTIVPGQRDYILKAIDKKPKTYAGYIVKNEEKDLPHSIQSLPSGVIPCIVDTGSTDGTVNYCISENIEVERYLDASAQNDSGDWQLWDFGKARNKYVEIIERKGADWILWMDADDTLTGEAKKVIKLAPYMPYDIHAFPIKTGVQSFHYHHRLWRAGWGVRYEGACHEYPKWPPTFRAKEWPDHFIIHKYEEGSGEGSVRRNLRILEKEYREKPSSRIRFYLANTYRDAAGLPNVNKEEYFRKAISLYEEYIAHPGSYHWELMHCYFYAARCYRFVSDRSNCERIVHAGMAKDTSFAELPMEAAYCAYGSRDYWSSISWCLQALSKSYFPRLFSEKNKYEDQPLRLLAWCYKHLGWKDLALQWGEQVKKFVVKDDSWDNFLRDLRNTPSTTEVINLLRPGALGDVLATYPAVCGLRKKYPNCKINFYTRVPDAANLLDVDMVLDTSLWDTRKSGLDFSLVGYPIKEGYPAVPMKKHLSQYFCEEVEVPFEDITLPKLPNLRTIPYMTLHIKTGWSRYKEWSMDKWIQLVSSLKEKYGVEICQIGSAYDPVVVGTEDLRGVPFAESVSYIQNAVLHLGVDSFSNHVAGLTKTPAVILFGSTSPTGSGYPTSKNIWLGYGCSPCYREDPSISSQSGGLCICPPGQTEHGPYNACMQNIPYERVLSEVEHYIQDHNIFPF